MKKFFLLLAAGLMTSSLIAQELPQPSPFCKTSQVVGLTNIDLEYSRPSVKGRTIFGDLVKFDEIWRVGANACTKITTDSELLFGDQTLKAGSYAIFAFPGKEEWKIVFNSDTEQWGAGNYDEAKNVVTVKSKSMVNSFNESLIVEINNIKANGANLTIKWEKVRIDIPFSVNTKDLAEANIKAAIEKGEELEAVYNRAGAYYLSSMDDTKTAMMYAEKSLAVKKTHNAMFLKARILKANDKNEEAIKAAEEALVLAQEAEATGWVEYIQGNIADWKKK